MMKVKLINEVKCAKSVRDGVFFSCEKCLKNKSTNEKGFFLICILVWDIGGDS